MEKSKDKTPQIIIGVIVLLLLIGGGYWYFSSQGSKSSQTTNSTKTTPTPTATVTPTQDVSTTTTPTLSTTPSVTSTPTSATGATSSELNPTGALMDVQVWYGGKDTAAKPDYVYYAIEKSTRKDPQNFMIERMIAGPNDYQKNTLNYYIVLKLTGESNCGSDFKITIDEATKKATVQFCKTIDATTANEKTNARSSVKYAMQQFPQITKEGTVVVLDKDGKVF